MVGHISFGSRSNMARLAIVVIGAGSLLMSMGCASAPRQGLPLTQSGNGVDIRVSSRVLTEHSVNVVVDLVASRTFADVTVVLASERKELRVSPASCQLGQLSPPVVAHATHAPYPLPEVPLCSFVATAVAPGSYPVTLRVESAGAKIFSPVKSIVVIPGV